MVPKTRNPVRIKNPVLMVPKFTPIALPLSRQALYDDRLNVYGIQNNSTKLEPRTVGSGKNKNIPGGCGMGQAVSRRLPTATDQVQSQVM
jgi:hypothetical protein